MDNVKSLLTPGFIRLLVASMTHDGAVQLSEIEVERFLNALTHANTQTPTGTNQ